RSAATMAAPRTVNLLVVSGPNLPELEVLKQLPPTVTVVAIGRNLDDLVHLTPEQWDSITVLLNCGVGKNAGKGDDIRGVYSNSLAEYCLTACNWFAKDLPRLRRQQEARRGQKGNQALRDEGHSGMAYVSAPIGLCGSSDLGRWVGGSAAVQWDPYEVEELRGKTMGIIGPEFHKAFTHKRLSASTQSIPPTKLPHLRTWRHDGTHRYAASCAASDCNDVSSSFLALCEAVTAATRAQERVLCMHVFAHDWYGDIGQACGRLAKAFRMRVVALRRRVELSAEEQAAGVVDKVFPPDQLQALMSVSDYVVMATPYTPGTHRMVDAAAIAAMRPHAVFINVGRGKCVDEAALVEALQGGRIRGAALDVFDTEPLPPDSPLWKLDNVLMSPHCADRTKEFQFESLAFFVENMGRFVAGQPLANVSDKKSGY
ncbi:hypothetical protein VOLCADRAFT_92635, partial [Volvox carteri f. nagariensis]